MTALKERKAAVRKQLIAMRDAMSAEARESASQCILEKVAHDAGYRNARMVLAYFGFGTELNTKPFLESALAEGKILVLPRIDRAGRVLELFRVRDFNLDLTPGPWGILEPKVNGGRRVRLGDIDWVLVPGLGFDAQCNRLGYGAGYYDTLFGNAQREGMVLPRRISGAFDCQFVEAVPVGAYDLPVDCVISESNQYNRKV